MRGQLKGPGYGLPGRLHMRWHAKYELLCAAVQLDCAVPNSHHDHFIVIDPEFVQLSTSVPLHHSHKRCRKELTRT